MSQHDPAPPSATAGRHAEEVAVDVVEGGRTPTTVRLLGRLEVPAGATGLVVSVCAASAGRYTPTERAIARALRADGLATLVLDLLTGQEELLGEHVAEVGVLGRRLGAVLDAVALRPDVGALPVGLLGAGTAAAVALVVAAQRDDVAAVVGRGGRPDLARPWLGRVRCPVLLVVGDRDVGLVEIHHRARAVLPGDSRLRVLDCDGHAFDEGASLGRTVELAGEWFARHLPGRSRGCCGHHAPGRAVTGVDGTRSR